MKIKKDLNGVQVHIRFPSKFLLVLTTVLMVLRLGHYAHIPWIVVLLPIGWPVLAFVFAMIIPGIIALGAGILYGIAILLSWLVRAYGWCAYSLKNKNPDRHA